MDKLSVALVGPGKVGSALKQQIAEAGWELPYVVRQAGVFTPAGEILSKRPEFDEMPPVDLTFITTPSKPIEHSYIDHYTYRNIPVVSSAKFTLSSMFDSVRERKHLIGPYAMVGGGTAMLPWIKDRLRGRRNVVMHGVLNGTFCFEWDQMDRERLSYGQAVKRAQKLGYAEPDAESLLDSAVVETRDTAYKSGIISNLCLDLPAPMCADKIEGFRPFGQKELNQVVDEAHEL